jgi:hypothetical protein
MVVAGHHKRRLPQSPQPGHARPPADAVEMAEVSNTEGHSTNRATEPSSKASRSAVPAARGVSPASRPARASRREHQTPYPVGCLVGQLVCDDPAEGHTDHVNPVVAERVTTSAASCNAYRPAVGCPPPTLVNPRHGSWASHLIDGEPSPPIWAMARCQA